jgi:hypothetical protein
MGLPVIFSTNRINDCDMIIMKYSEFFRRARGQALDVECNAGREWKSGSMFEHRRCLVVRRNGRASTSACTTTRRARLGAVRIDNTTKRSGRL